MNWRTVALQAWNGYTAALALVWSPFVAILTFIRAWSLLIIPLLVLAFAGGMGLMVCSAFVESWLLALLGLAAAFPPALLLAALIWIYVVRLRIGVDLLQIPAGEIAEVLREGGQLARVQDPKVRDGEGNIRLFNSAAIMTLGKRAFCLPAWVLTMGAWMVPFPHVLTLAVLGMVGVGMLAAAFWLRQRGRKVGLGFDFLAGVMLHYIFGGVATILFRAVFGQWWRVLAGGVSGSTMAVPAPVGLDGLLANVWYRLFHNWITWYVPAHTDLLTQHAVAAQWPHSGDVLGVVVGALLLLGFIGFHVAVISVIVRLLREPPEGEARLGAKAGIPGIAASGTVGRGDGGGDGGGWILANAWIFLLAVASTIATLVFIAHLIWPTNQTLCQTNPFGFLFVLVLWLIWGVLWGLRRYFPRTGNVIGWLTTVSLIAGIAIVAHARWDEVGGICRTRIAAMERSAEPPRSDPPPATSASRESPPPPRRSDPWAPARAEEGRIRAYFAEHGDECPDAAGRSGWEAYRDAVGACQSESWRVAYSDYGR
ncbi:hypothetical protein EPO33_04095 [Patescibacteria group bacterium]|nr:MAG: hypothetical protein EPO33_04095 [Patescibacteria group bacterium]